MTKMSTLACHQMDRKKILQLLSCLIIHPLTKQYRWFWPIWSLTRDLVETLKNWPNEMRFCWRGLSTYEEIVSKQKRMYWWTSWSQTDSCKLIRLQSSLKLHGEFIYSQDKKVGWKRTTLSNSSLRKEGGRRLTIDQNRKFRSGDTRFYPSNNMRRETIPWQSRSDKTPLNPIKGFS